MSLGLCATAPEKSAQSTGIILHVAEDEIACKILLVLRQGFCCRCDREQNYSMHKTNEFSSAYVRKYFKRAGFFYNNFIGFVTTCLIFLNTRASNDIHRNVVEKVTRLACSFELLTLLTKKCCLDVGLILISSVVDLFTY